MAGNLNKVTFTHYNDDADGVGPGTLGGVKTNKVSIDGSQSADSKLYQDASTIEGALYITGGTISGYIVGNVAPLVGGTEGTDVNGDGAITPQYIIAGSDAEDGVVFDSDADMSWDDHSLKQVTEPPETGLTIVTESEGETRGWDEDSGFGKNDIVSFEIYNTTFTYGNGWYPIDSKLVAEAGEASDLEIPVTIEVGGKYQLIITTEGATDGELTPKLGNVEMSAIGTENTQITLDEMVALTTGYLILQKDADWDGKITAMTLRKVDAPGDF